MEVQAIGSAFWRWSSRPPTALELASDLQLLRSDPEPAYEAELAVVGPRTFVGEPTALAEAARATAAQLAGRSPVVTVWAPDLAPLGIDQTGYGPPLPWPLDSAARLTPLRLPLPAASDGGRRAPLVVPPLKPGEIAPPPANPWVPTRFEQPTSPMARVAYRLPRTGPQPNRTKVAPLWAGECGVLQLPGCVEPRDLRTLPGSRAALADALCIRGVAPSVQRPQAVAILQLRSGRPAAATSRQAAQAELWRLTLVQGLTETSSAAARAGLKCEVSYNAQVYLPMSACTRICQLSTRPGAIDDDISCMRMPLA